MRAPSLILVLICCTAFTACNKMRNPQVKGSGNETTQQRTIGDFSRLEVNGTYSVSVRCGSSPSLTLTGDDNLLPLVKTEIRNATLKIYSEQSLSSHTPVAVILGVESLCNVEADGASTVHIENDSTNELSLTINGSGTMEAAGVARYGEYTINGSGTFAVDQLKAREVSITVNGAGTATVYASESLEASVIGTGTVNFYGNPQHVKRNITGIGSIVKMNP